MSADPATTAVVLAAGAGTRMRSGSPKVLQPVAGRPILVHVLVALRAARLTEAVIVVGETEPAIRDALREPAAQAALDGMALRFARQESPRGTAHAVQAAREAVTTARALVLYADLGLLEPAHVRPILAAPDAAVALATARLDEPGAMGRIVREDGVLRRIVEARDADAATLAINEVNVGIWRFDTDWLWPALEALQPAANGELYLTDALEAAMREGHALGVDVPLPDGRLNIEDRRDLSRAEGIARRRIVDRWLDAGVSVLDPATTYIGADVEIGQDTVLEPGVHLRGICRIGPENQIGPNAVLEDVTSGPGCQMESCTLREARLGARVEVGAYSTIRPGTVLDDDVRVGTHAEVKNAHLGAGVQMGHFSYVGDADVGPGTNIGAGAITCNFDGERKHRTWIGAGAFIGSDSLLIAPVSIGDGAATGAGAVVNHDVPAGARALGHPARVRRGGEAER